MSNPMRDLKAIIDKLEQPTHGTRDGTPDAGVILPDLSASGSMEIAQITRDRIAGDVSDNGWSGY